MYKGLSINERDHLRQMTKVMENQVKIWNTEQLQNYVDSLSGGFTPKQLQYMAWYLNNKVEEMLANEDDHYFGMKD